MLEGLNNAMILGAVSSDISSVMQASMTAIKDDVVGAIMTVAPVAISIMGLFLVWKYGFRFFKGLSK